MRLESVAFAVVACGVRLMWLSMEVVDVFVLIIVSVGGVAAYICGVVLSWGFLVEVLCMSCRLLCAICLDVIVCLGDDVAICLVS